MQVRLRSADAAARMDPHRDPAQGRISIAHAEFCPCVVRFSIGWGGLCDRVWHGVVEACIEHVSSTSHEGNGRTVAEWARRDIHPALVHGADLLCHAIGRMRLLECAARLLELHHGTRDYAPCTCGL